METVERPKSRRARLASVLVRDRWRIFGLLLVGGAIGAIVGFELTIPRWLRLFAVAGVVAAVLGYPVAARVVAWLFRPGYTYLLSVDARGSDLELWQLPPSTWREIVVEDGELFQVQASAPAWECETYDPEENVATGTWRGSASDLELIADRERIDEIRGVLEELAKEGLTLRVKQSGIIRSAVRGIVMSFVEGFERSSFYDGEQIEAAVDDALDRWSSEDEDEDEPGEDGPGSDGSLTEENVGRPDPLGVPDRPDLGGEAADD